MKSVTVGFSMQVNKILILAEHYQLPDLRNRFLLGADITKAAGDVGDYTSSTFAGAPGPKGIVGSNIKTLSIAEMPPHIHHVGNDFNAGFPSSYAAAGSNGVGDAITSSVGGGSSFDLRPRAYGIVYIMKVKK
jgi:hypothetical protein